ncbi:hypothetical protein OH784_13575 [Ectobacillus funiculus]|uniref:hypothetical protein n=1 Tax=Ectobacillus funiculus TaxID=137993 RepID=UPI00397E3F8F
MVGKIIILFVIYTAILVYDVRKWKQVSVRERFIYGALMLATVYLSLIYVMDKSWLNLNDLINFLFSEPAKRIVESVKAPI